MNIQEAKRLIDRKWRLDQVRRLTGVTEAIFYQLKREYVAKFNKPVDYGCTVCGCKSTAKGFCDKHYYRYVSNPRRISKIKGL